MKKFVSILVLVFACGKLMAQDIDAATNSQNLLRLADRLYNSHTTLYEESKRIASEKGIPIDFTNEYGNRYVLQYIDKAGRPVYFATKNSDAASTTSTDDLQIGGSSGFDLSGEGITVGVFDGGWSRNTHVEFETRVTNKTGSETDDHATHVMGTILAAGINPNVKGMAPKATGLAYDALGNFGFANLMQ